MYIYKTTGGLIFISNIYKSLTKESGYSEILSNKIDKYLFSYLYIYIFIYNIYNI